MAKEEEFMSKKLEGIYTNPSLSHGHYYEVWINDEFVGSFPTFEEAKKFYISKKEEEKPIEDQVKKWLELIEEFKKRIKDKKELGDIFREFKKFIEEKNLDVFDIEAIAKGTYGPEQGSLLYSLIMKDMMKKEELKKIY